jgi:hypothetical protein
LRKGEDLVPRWIAVAPISIRLETERLLLDNLVISRYNWDQLKNILADDVCYWPEVSLDLEYKLGYWLNFETEAESSQEAYKKFNVENITSADSDQSLKRIYWAKYYLRKSYETANLNERYIFLSIALEALCGAGESELKYRYANRTALILGDDTAKRKEYYSFVLKAYDTRSKIVHGSIKWKIQLEDVLKYSEIIRQMVLRCISLYSNEVYKVGKILDECLHDPTKHADVLEKSKSLFGPVSEYKQPEIQQRFSHNFRIRK